MQILKSIKAIIWEREITHLKHTFSLSRFIDI